MRCQRSVSAPAREGNQYRERGELEHIGKAASGAFAQGALEHNLEIVRKLRAKRRDRRIDVTPGADDLDHRLPAKQRLLGQIQLTVAAAGKLAIDRKLAERATCYFPRCQGNGDVLAETRRGASA